MNNLVTFSGYDLDDACETDWHKFVTNKKENLALLLL